MSKLIFNLISKNFANAPNLLARIRPTSRRSLILANTNQVRRLASVPNNQVTKSNETAPSKSNQNVNEFDKPQWERSDRYRIFYGFSHSNEAEDKAWAHYHGFFGIFAMVLFPCFVIYYYPDYKSEDWAYREAYLQLARREKSGEPLVSPDYVPIEKINLPSDEELGDMEIII